MESGGYTPHQMHEYQNKGLTKWAFHKQLIPKGIFLVVVGEKLGQTEMATTKKTKSGSKAPALQMEFSMTPSVPKR